MTNMKNKLTYYEKSYQITKKNMETFDHLAPVIFVETADKKIVVCVVSNLPAESEAKDKMMFGLGSKMAEEGLDIVSLFFVCESWFVKLKMGNKIKLPIRDLPEKKEALVGSYYSKSGEKKMIMTPFVRNADKTIAWEKEIIMEQSKDKKGKLAMYLLDGFWSGYAVGKSLLEQTKGGEQK